MRQQSNRPRPIATLLSGMLLAFGLSVTTVILLFTGFILWQADRVQEQTEAALFESIRSELELGYSAMTHLLQGQGQLFQSVHERALDRIQDENTLELDSLQAELETLAGMPVDVYLISPELVVENTTYAPDQDLDFRHPALLDGRVMIEKALAEDRIVVSAPVLEAVARDFRIYTYSPLGETGHVLELGFIPPLLNQYFKDMDENLAARERVQAQLHFLMWDDWLLSLHPDRSDATDKQALLSTHYERKREQIRLFQEARDTGEPVKVSRSGESPEYYFHVMAIDGDGNWHMDLVARVHMDAGMVGEARVAVVTAISVVLVLLLLITVLHFYLARRTVALPLTHAAKAIERWQPITLAGGGQQIRELQLLASHYNGMLDAARSRIRGLDREVRTDSLTGLINRAGLEAELDIELRRSERYQTGFAIILLDLDHFKAVNDEHGHLVGDQMLKDLATTLRTRSRASDSVGRWGGEEFLILCRDTGQKEAMALAEDLRAAVEARARETATGRTASFGVASYQTGDGMEEVFDRADRALYRAKQQGRNRVAGSDTSPEA